MIGRHAHEFVLHELARGDRLAEGRARLRIVACRLNRLLPTRRAHPGDAVARLRQAAEGGAQAAWDECRPRLEAIGRPVITYPSGDDGVKVSAAWLVENAGFHRGFGDGPVGISSKHALALVNRGGATANDVQVFAKLVQAAVLEQFGVTLQPEPVFLGF